MPVCAPFQQMFLAVGIPPPAVLANASITATGSSTANVSIDTDTAGGTMYFVVSPAANIDGTLTAAEIVAGQDIAGAAAYASNYTPISGTNGSGTIGLVNNTAYLVAFVQHTASGYSNVKFAAASATTFVPTFQSLEIGGGGFTTGIDITPDGQSLTCRIDVANCYRYNFSTSRWENLCTGAKIGAPTFSVTAIGGGIEVVSAPSNSTIIYMWTSDDGALYRSTNSGGVFTKLTGFGTHDINQANVGAKRLNGKKMAVDPANPDILYVGTIDNGVMVSTNATTTASFASTTGITAAGGNGYALAFDARVSQRTGGSSNILYVHSDTNGVFSMSAPGGAFSHMAGSPAAADHMEVSPNGIIWLADNASGTSSATLNKCVSGAWTQFTTATVGVRPHSVAIDTTRSGGAAAERIIVGEDSGKLSITSDSGSHWPTGVLTFTRTATDVPWLAETNEFYMSNGNMVYDATRDLIWFAEGIGVWTAPGSTATNFVWTSATAGIESLQFNGVISSAAATNAPSMYAWDRGFYKTTDPSTYSAHQTVPVLTSIEHGWAADWASSDGSTLTNICGIVQTGLTGSVQGGLDVSGTSTDNGTTWLPYALNTTMTNPTIVASGASAAGQNDITCSTAFPAWFGKGMVVVNATHPNTTLGWVSFVDPATKILTMDRPLTGTGVSNGDSLKVGYPGSATMCVFAVTTQTLSGGTVLHFTGLPANKVQPGYQVFNLSNLSSLPVNTGANSVLSVSGSDVTLSNAISANINVGDIIQFVAGPGGAIAAASPTNFVATRSNDDPFPVYTIDGGATWNPASTLGLSLPQRMLATYNGTTTVTVASTSSLLTGSRATLTGSFIPNNTNIVSITDATHFVMSNAATGSGTALMTPLSGWGHSYTLDMLTVAADRVTPDTFYAYNELTEKCYKSSDKGATWTAQNSVNLTNAYIQDAALKAVPGNAGHLFLSDYNHSFMRSTDGGANWTAVSSTSQGSVSQVVVFAFGKPIATYPTVWMWGTLGSDFSLWMSSDNCLSWTKVIGATDVTPFGTRDNIIALDADKTITGRIYGTFNFSGAFYGQV